MCMSEWGGGLGGGSGGVSRLCSGGREGKGAGQEYFCKREGVRQTA